MWWVGWPLEVYEGAAKEEGVPMGEEGAAKEEEGVPMREEEAEEEGKPMKEEGAAKEEGVPMREELLTATVVRSVRAVGAMAVGCIGSVDERGGDAVGGGIVGRGARTATVRGGQWVPLVNVGLMTDCPF